MHNILGVSLWGLICRVVVFLQLAIKTSPKIKMSPLNPLSPMLHFKIQNFQKSIKVEQFYHFFKCSIFYAIMLIALIVCKAIKHLKNYKNFSHKLKNKQKTKISAIFLWIISIIIIKIITQILLNFIYFFFKYLLFSYYMIENFRFKVTCLVYFHMQRTENKQNPFLQPTTQKWPNMGNNPIIKLQQFSS